MGIGALHFSGLAMATSDGSKTGVNPMGDTIHPLDAAIITHIMKALTKTRG